MTAEREFELLGKEFETIKATLEKPKVAMKVPSCIEIGLQASKKGDFTRARQMFRIAMDQLPETKEKPAQLINLIIHTADTYMNEWRYDMAKQWYEKALHRSELLPVRKILQSGCLMTRLAEVNVLQKNMPEFKKCFEIVQRIYLLSKEADTSMLLNGLIDLSWVLCVQGHL